MVIPSDFKHKVVVSRQELKDMVGRISVLALEKNSKMRLEFEPDKILASYTSAEYGSSEQPIDAEMDGESISLGFFVGNFQDILSIFTQDTITLNIVDQETPIMITGEDFSDGFGVVMPIRLEYLDDDFGA